MKTQALTQTFRLLLFLLTPLPALSGCQRGSGFELGSVEGSVTSNGKPLTLGVVSLFSPETGWGDSCVLSEAGRFRFNELRVGNYCICVSPPVVEPDALANKEVEPLPAAHILDKLIPRKYRQESTSPLTMIIKAGSNSIELDL